MDSNNKNAIILCSGGLDSVTTAYYIKKTLNYNNLKILFFNYNQHSYKAEKIASQKCAEKLQAEFIEISLPFLADISTSLINQNKQHKHLTKQDLKNTKKESEKFYVPFRNSIFLSYAIALADSLNLRKKQSYDIFTGFKCEGKEPYPDTTKEYIESFNNLIKTSKVNTKILAPLIEKDKDEIIQLANQLKINLRDTHSCYISNKHCGTCLACMLRKQGFYWANLKDLTDYTR